MVLKGKTLVKQEPLSLKKSQYSSWDLKSSSFKIFNGLVADVKHYSCASMCKKSEHGRKEVDEIHEFKLCTLQSISIVFYVILIDREFGNLSMLVVLVVSLLHVPGVSQTGYLSEHPKLDLFFSKN